MAYQLIFIYYLSNIFNLIVKTFTFIIINNCSIVCVSYKLNKSFIIIILN